MRGSSQTLTLGLAAALALTAHAVRAQGDPSNISSQRGNALSRSTSAEALVSPKPAFPPNSAARESGKGRAVLIAIGALIALAMFLWERRSQV